MCEVRIRYSKSRIEYNKGMIDKNLLRDNTKKGCAAGRNAGDGEVRQISAPLPERSGKVH